MVEGFFFHRLLPLAPEESGHVGSLAQEEDQRGHILSFKKGVNHDV